MSIMNKVQLLSPKKRFRDGMIEDKTFSGMLADTIIIIILIAIAFACLVPLWHVFIASISDGQTLLRHAGLLIWPVGQPTLDGYSLVLRDNSIVSGYFNTIIYVVGEVGFGVVLNVLAGYVLSRRTKLRRTLTIFVVFTLLFSGGTVPIYMVVRSLGMVGTRWALILPQCTNAAFLIMMVKAFESVPQSTVESARIDGAGHIRTMFQVMLPQCFSYMLVIMINTGILAWNAWFHASIYVPSSKNLWPLQLWIRSIVSTNQDFMNWTNPDYSRYLIQYSVIILSTVPVLLLFPFFQKRLEKGIAAGAVKE